MNVEEMYVEVDVRVCEHGLYVWAPNSVGKLYAPTYLQRFIPTPAS